MDTAKGARAEMVPTEVPYSKSSACDELKESCACLAYIESVNTKVSEEEAQQDTYQPVFRAYVRVVIQPASAFFTKSGIVIYECPTFTAIHNLEFKVTDTTKIIPFSKMVWHLKS